MVLFVWDEMIETLLFLNQCMRGFIYWKSFR